MCSDFWSRADVAVACRQLGFSSIGSVEHTNAAFGEGTGLILLDDLRCNGFEYRLFDCTKRTVGLTNCQHHQDAGVACTPGNSKFDDDIPV